MQFQVKLISRRFTDTESRNKRSPLPAIPTPSQAAQSSASPFATPPPAAQAAAPSAAADTNTGFTAVPSSPLHGFHPSSPLPSSLATLNNMCLESIDVAGYAQVNLNAGTNIYLDSFAPCPYRYLQGSPRPLVMSSVALPLPCESFRLRDPLPTRATIGPGASVLIYPVPWLPNVIPPHVYMYEGGCPHLYGYKYHYQCDYWHGDINGSFWPYRAESVQVRGGVQQPSDSWAWNTWY